MLPFRGNLAKTLGAELDLQGFATALHTIVHQHKQGVLAALCTLDPEFKDTLFEVRGQVHGTGDTNSHTGIVTCNKFDFHGKSAFHGILVRKNRLGVFTGILIGISTTTRNSFTHNNRDNFLIGAERLRRLLHEAGLVTVAIITEPVTCKRRRGEDQCGEGTCPDGFFQISIHIGTSLHIRIGYNIACFLTN